MESLRKQRGTVKSRLTRLESKVENAIKSELEVSSEEIEVYISRLDEIRKEFDEIRRQVDACPGEASVADASEDEVFDDRYLNLKIVLKRMQNRLSTTISEKRTQTSDDALARVLQQQTELIRQVGAGGSQAPAANNDAITELIAQQTELIRRFSGNGGAVHESKPRLPVVEIPKFSGQMEDWTRFSATFKSVVHNNENIPDVQKFQYLLTAITGNAAKLIESIDLTNENYSVAWALLTKRYDDPRAIKKKHIQCLFNMPKVDKESSTAIRELVDYTLKHIRILKVMDSPTDSWNELIIHMIEAKLDVVTLREWELHGNAETGTLDSITDFLQQRCQILERIESRSKQKDVMNKSEGDKQNSKNRNQPKSKHNEKTSTLTTVIENGKCYLCQGEHFLYQCDKFLAMPVDMRLKEVQRMKLCINCLRNDHFAKKCRLRSCKQCSGRHNTLLHGSIHVKESSNGGENVNNPGNSSSSNVAVHHAANGPKTSRVIMATAIVNAVRSNGSSTAIRILLDSASEANFITQAACNKLGVKRDRTTEIVTGLNEIQSQICQSCDIVVQSMHSSYKINVRCLVVPTITKSLPSVEINRDEMQIPSNVKLADFSFHKPSSIDMLLGAEYFFDMLEAEKIELGKGRPILQNTKLGWIIAGNIAHSHFTSLTCSLETITTLNCSVEYCETLNKNLEKFWELETFQLDSNKILSADERKCEEIFEQTTTRDSSGRFIVRLPFRENPFEALGKSRDIANRRLLQLERRFERNKTLRDRYVEFMREYQQLGHMTLVQAVPSADEKRIVYLPHHGVIKESSSSTKLRAVFDASSKTDSGLALNDILYVGPTLQSGLIEIVLRFRFHNVALTGDLKKMYRQISVHAADRDYQRILWRESPKEPVQEYQLNTVTYGEASSSYLAIKCIRDLAKQAEKEYPIASRVILDEMYVDDFMTGAVDVQGVNEIQRQLTELLQTAGFESHKWCSNRSESLLDFSHQDNREDIQSYSIDINETIKTLGLEWNPNDDNFQFSVEQTETISTKRQILSAISKFFDPLGLIGPILTMAKLLMQETWRLDYNWDDPLPDSFIDKWEYFRQQLSTVETIRIPRRVTSCERPKRTFIQGFCDASERAYGACLYIQSEDEDGNLAARLLCAKSRVAPIKATSIPRLELCSAVLLARLIASVKNSLRIPIDSIQAWTDSTVALCWIRGDPSRWKPFVSNRVSEIVQILPMEAWDHVRGEENPADLISRGATPQQLRDSELWWFGPQWLATTFPELRDQPTQEISREILQSIETEERKSTTVCNFVNIGHEIISEIIDKFSSLTKMERVLAYCIRYVSNLKKGPTDRIVGRLTIPELQESHRRLIKHAQERYFDKEIKALNSERSLKNSSKILQLHPFLDRDGVLRVGGRLQNAALSFARTHPILLPAESRVSRLLFEREHLRLLHASQLLLLSSIRERYWTLKGRDLARQVCHGCVWCTRNKPRDTSQLMGSLPSRRVQPSRAFTVTGVDFAGPITTLVNKGRGRKTNKSYIALFVCFSTKAIHLEATSELTTVAFLATLRRFIGRRGRPRTIYSDNGTNFVGANRELKEVHDFIRAEIEGKICDDLTSEHVEWIFIPPHSPHMGGLWEAGVKSCKYHLKRVMGNTLFTFEELATALSQIEACLNSRPLSSMSADPMDLQPLTPAHFLIGEALTSLPDLDVTDVQVNRLSRWQIIQKTLQDFWKRWATEYISNLQGRVKWQTTQENLKINDLVIVRDETLPPLKWKLARVVELHSGADGLVRVVTVRTSSGNFKRSIAKLCKLPIASNNDD